MFVSICLLVCVFVCSFVCLFVRLSVCLSVFGCLLVCLLKDAFEINLVVTDCVWVCFCVKDFI